MIWKASGLTFVNMFFFAYNLKMGKGTLLILTKLSGQCQYL